MDKRWKPQVGAIKKERWKRSPKCVQWALVKGAKRKTKVELRAELEAAADEIEVLAEVYDEGEEGSAYAKHQNGKRSRKA